jgi:hypothetical protein
MTTAGGCRALGAIGCVVSLCVLVLMSGCAGPQNLPRDVTLLATSDEGLSPAAAALLQEAKRHARTRASGSLVGGVAGTLTGILPSRGASGGGAQSAITGGLGGAGAVLGYAFGDYIDARNTRANMDQQKLSLLVAAADADARHYEQDRINAHQAIQEAREAVSGLNQESAALARAKAGYQSQAKSLSATAASLAVLLMELRANIKIMSEDVREAEDNRQIGDTDLHPEALEAERAKLQAEHDALFSQYSELVQVVNTMPAVERPVIAGLEPQ